MNRQKYKVSITPLGYESIDFSNTQSDKGRADENIDNGVKE